MNFSAVRGFNAYAQFTASIRDAVNSRQGADNALVSDTPETEQDISRSKGSASYALYSEPIDIVTISEPARNASNALMVLREKSPHTEFRKWIKTENMLRAGFTQELPGSVMNNVLSGSGISVADDEKYSLSVDVWSEISVSSKNAEKAKAIQNLLNSTPSGINWGLLLATLPPK